MNKLILLLLIMICVACGNEEGSILPAVQENKEWLIPIEEVRDGGVGRDGIPSIDNPTYSTATEQEVVLDYELITGVLIDGIPVAFPHKILDYHEIVNTEHGDFAYALSFCPLTGTSIVYPRDINGSRTTFGVSGLLFNSNLILYDRGTESLWSQMMLQSVNGPLMEQEIPFTQVIEATWAAWKAWYPKTLVLDPPNGRPRSYDQYAYGGYRENQDLLLFPVKSDFSDIPQKERILGIVANGRMSYVRFNQFENGVKHLRIKIQQDDYLIFGGATDRALFAYLATTENGDSVEVDELFDDRTGGRLFKDTEGNAWSIFGEAISGSLQGQKLQQKQNFVGYTFAMASFYPDDFFNKDGF
jgi:hypothetical protein